MKTPVLMCFCLQVCCCYSEKSSLPQRQHSNIKNPVDLTFTNLRLVFETIDIIIHLLEAPGYDFESVIPNVSSF